MRNKRLWEIHESIVRSERGLAGLHKNTLLFILDLRLKCTFAFVECLNFCLILQTVVFLQTFTKYLHVDVQNKY